jgi:anthranilate phosphoribosyltransferase
MPLAHLRAARWVAVKPTARILIRAAELGRSTKLVKDVPRVQDLLQRLARGENLSQAEVTQVVDTIMQGGCAEDDIAALLLALREKGETVEEIAGAARALRRHMTPIRTSRTGLLDTCGTGGDRSGTFNISTAAALVTAAGGVPVAKHGNRSITSKSGSADVLAALGVNIDAPVPIVERCLNELGICFCFVPHLHPSMKHVAPVRKRLGVPTIFNLLGPLCNPAGAPFQLLGVGRPALRPLLSAALGLLGTQRAAVVCGADGLDEVTLSGPTQVTLVTPAGLEELSWSPADFGLASGDLSALQVDGPQASAVMVRAVLDGRPGPAREIVVLNAAAALWTAGREADLTACARLAVAAIDSGAAARVLADFVALSRS